MHLKLYKLKLKNFKGTRDIEFDFAGEDANIYGANATGKTTLFDAFTWLLFGKDSLNSAAFDVKPLSQTGEAEHGLEHEVESTLDIDGKIVTLRKILAEKWTKRRGSADREFTGHSVTYFVDGVPKAEREYKAIIAGICDETTFRLLTNPRHFSESMKWQDRRKVILEVCGDITDADVIASSSDLASLPGILKDRTLEDHRKVITSEHKRINDELEKIPIRISEQQQSISDTANLDPKSIRSRIAHLTTQKQEQERELADLRHGGEIAAKTKALREIESKILDIENKERRVLQKAEEEHERLRRNIRGKILTTEELIARQERTLILQQNQIKGCADMLAQLRADWHQENSKEFVCPQSDTCPTCGQALPAGQIESARLIALAEFNEQRAQKLAEINQLGRKVKAEQEECQKLVEKIISELPALKAELVEYQKAIERLDDPLPEPPPNPERQKLLDGKAILEAALSDLLIGSHDDESEILARTSEIETEITGQQQLLASIDMTDKARKRIEILKREERELAAEYERLEGELFLTERFVQRKVQLLEEKINRRFQLARFKLFEQQINGGLLGCCEITIDGVPYWSANNAARTQAGLDVCNSMAEHFGFHPPVWIDNRESVTAIPGMDCQVISLIVNPEDKTLRFETMTSARKAA